MSDNRYRPDDATEAFPPHQPQSGQGQGPQGKLILGNFHQQQQNQRPAQPFPPQQPGAQPFNQPHQHTPAQHQQHNYVPQQPAPNAYPSHQPGPGPRPGQGGQAGNTPQPPMKPRKRRNKRKIGCLSVLAVLVVLIIVGAITTQRALAFGSAISTQAPLTTQTGYMSTDQRTNLLVMGYGGGTHDGANLTDSLVVISMIPSTRHTSLVSIPRDLWVQNPPNSGNFSKINAVYQTASNNGQNRTAGADAMTTKVSLVTGMDVKYWMMIDFTGFKTFIDSIGGVDVYVPDSFNACYPNNDDAAKDASWRVVDFEKGNQHMDGATAIAYARAREPMSVCSDKPSKNQAELTDFGRSARQQIIIKAALAKLRDIGTWPRFFSAMDALEKTVHTNMSLADLGLFSQKMDLNDPHTAHIGLSTSNVMAIDTASDGESIVVPQGNNWGLIPAYIKQHLYN
ncbi:LCP family protein [Dictyobacter aurantiacus]|uniref:Cell envelope-related transcriptional attenuator domain-containing protein n=1 Tax=Dictyobacter aurantiacus TaxID=1936993 RepID=A0A401Z860_9CHLR|nr:LCP family protein [Dictyobacter aurantiacus]GCE03033.1 hypothetical protein KDAU_03620 [Dictyobacter aurantiacus]